ncbi:alpha/beta fold hydrolase [Actinomadura rubteroloni]|uniref:alpha/beta fold hydrolase n=1 Tax=Actinomadura rubteroloni TaxID=1926885 RepID=UPI00143D5739|nr:alpha/beta hydrolase [Actinomadura rubteroloni]
MTAPPPDVPGVEHAFVDVGGLRTHVALAGAGDPLVLLHGWPQHWWQWRHVLPRLAERHRVVCPDLRGLGWTDAPRDGYRPAVMARDVLGLLDRLGVREFGLVGHDWGGLAAYLIALRHPGRVRGLVAINTASPFTRPTPGTLPDGARLWHILANATGPRLAGSAIPRWALRHWVHRTGTLPPEDQAVYLRQFEDPERVRATVRYYRGLVAREIPAILAGRYRRTPLTVPTLVLAGDRDPLLPVRGMSGFGPRAADLRVKVLGGVGHFPATEDPDAVAGHVLDFFAKLSGPPTRGGTARGRAPAAGPA